MVSRVRVLSFPGGRVAQESRKHYNQLEEARKQQHARKLKLEAQEVALGERDRVTATMGDALFMGEDKTKKEEVLLDSLTFDKSHGWCRRKKCAALTSMKSASSLSALMVMEGGEGGLEAK